MSSETASRAPTTQCRAHSIFKIGFYNKNDNLGVILTYDFFMSNSGVISLHKKSGVFKPQNYNFSTLDASNQLNLKSVILLFWFLQWLVFFLRAIVDLFLRIQMFLLKRQLDLDWFKFIEYWLLIMCLTILLLWANIFQLTAEPFSLPLDEDQFMVYVAQSNEINLLNQSMAITSILLMAKNLRALTSSFPAFGVLFETINAARIDLLYFTIMSGALAIATTVICYCLFGPNES